ncbi:MAG TPA: M28 family peptidase [Terriglobales bacterium]|nr:M28 family peptidase [Terriglobales bacterium]
MRGLVPLLVLLLCPPLAVAQAPQPKGLPAGAVQALRSIDPERLRAHVKFLASDLLEGRGTGQRGGELAAAYIATQLELYGLKPAGENGTYFQGVPLLFITTQPTSFAVVPASGSPMELKFGDDYVVLDQTGNAVSDVDSEIVYVGYGISAPEYQWDDYKGADVRGKVLLMLVNEPPSTDPQFFKGPALTYYGRWTYKHEEAARRGAAGVLLIHTTDMASYGWEVVRNSNAGEKAQLADDPDPKLRVAAWVQAGVARRIAGAAGKDLEQLMKDARSRDFRPVVLPMRLKAHMVNRVRRARSDNVLAILPGSDRRLQDEAVLYTAHYDHLGIRPDQAGDNIYNGAADNATGCAILLELARAFAGSGVRPARSVLFAAVTAEEQGLRGSQYLGKHPPLAAGKITLALNYDDLPPIGDPEEGGTYGAERTSFYAAVQQTAREFQLQLRPDPNPNAGFYYRSDHFSLARAGVPAFSVSEGRKFKGHPREWGDQQAAEYNAKRYHQPSDEYDPGMDFSGNARMARFGFVLGWRAAGQRDLIGWTAGDEFEAARKRSQASGAH